jgi:hypothetical protein
MVTSRWSGRSCPVERRIGQAKLSALMGDMHGAFSVQINALQSALTKLQTVVKGVGIGSSSIAEISRHHF